jgi:DNA-binding transcriptional regulator GbsR (MarR family)
MKKRSSTQLTPELKRLSDSIGEFIQYFGFKAIHGRIWALLFLSERPMAAVELCKLLKVSKTLLSFSIAELLKFYVIQKAGKGTGRTTFYEANPQVAEVILGVLRQREQVMMETIQQNHQDLERAQRSQHGFPGLKKERINEMGQLIAAARIALEAFVHSPKAQVDLGDQFAVLATLMGMQRERA